MVFQERTYSVLIVTASDSFTAKIMPLLPVTDYWPVTTVHSIGEAHRKIAETAFDIVLINAPLPDDFGMRLAGHLHQQRRRCPPSGPERSV
jgi:DNA-binding response OmpR family regulator